MQASTDLWTPNVPHKTLKSLAGAFTLDQNSHTGGTANDGAARVDTESSSQQFCTFPPNNSDYIIKYNMKTGL